MNISFKNENIINIVQKINNKTSLNNYDGENVNKCGIEKDDSDNSDNEEDYNNSETDNLIESSCYIIDDTINNNPLELSNPKFNDNLKYHVENILYEQLKDIYDIDIIFSLIENIYTLSYNTYFSNIMPSRSYDSSFIRRIPNVSKMTKKINHIRNKPQPEQRTSEWYSFRHELITASNAWKALDTQGCINSLIYEKCVPSNTSKFDTLNTTTPFHWGHKYEPLSVMYYEYTYKTSVEDFGCLPHDKYSFLGASPDGINTDKKSYRYGRMLEIKNIVNREINGIPKKEYWIQMQLQMEVCELNECDFLETHFKEYENEEEFNNDGTFTKTETGNLKGIILYFIKDGQYHYEYSPLHISKDDFEKWEFDIMEKNKSNQWIQNIYWKLEKVSCVLVLRNKFWFKNCIDKFKNIWQTIEYERKNGYEHRAPVKREKKKIQPIVDNKPNKCLLNVKQVSNVECDSNCNVSIPDVQIDKFKKIRTESFDDVEKNKEEILNIVMKNVFD